MFKFQRIISAGIKWTDNLYINDVFVGTMGFDEEGLWIKAKRNFTLQEINLLIAQIMMSNPNLVTEKLEIINMSN